jgi:hypothetical protein
MSGLLEQPQYQDIFRLVENKIGCRPQLFYLHVGTMRKYLEDSFWRGFTDSKIIEIVKKDIAIKRENIGKDGCYLIIDFEGCGIFNKTLMGLCPKIIKQIVNEWINIVWGSYIIRPNTFTGIFLNLIMTFIPHERHNKVTIVKGGLFELVIILDKLERHIDEKQWLRNRFLSS